MPLGEVDFEQEKSITLIVILDWWRIFFGDSPNQCASSIHTSYLVR